MNDVEVFLERLGLERYSEAFAENDIDFETLKDLTADDLREIGVASVGHRRKLLKAIDTLKVPHEAPGESSPAAKDEPATLDAELRQVTVMFADLAGYTRLSNTLEPEEAHRLLNAYFNRVDTIVRTYGGSVDKHIGDGVMAVFGAPIAHEDDPLRAVRAALDIHSAMVDLSEESDCEMRAHIGIASGQVIASGTGSDVHKEYTVTGRSVNLASRLQDLAKAEETLISDGVFAAVEQAASCAPRGEAEVKGFPSPIRIWRVTGLESEPASQAATQFAGRSKELRQFESCLEDCLDTRSGHVLLLRGEAGIGKSRLAKEFARLASRKGFETHHVPIFDFGAGQGQDALRSLVRSLLGLHADANAEDRGASANSAFDSGILSESDRPFVHDLLGLPQPAELRATYELLDNTTRTRGIRDVVSALIRNRSRQAPLVVTIEDIHWADVATLNHLADLAAVTSEAPFIFVMTTRLEGSLLSHDFRAAMNRVSVNTIDLGPLREEDAMAIVRSLADVDNPIMRECLGRSQGNPLFLEHLLRHAQSEGANNVPDTIQSLVLARADRLPARDKKALQAAAVLGQRFDPEAVRELANDPDYDCRALMDANLVLPDDFGFSFSHALIRDGVYQSLVQARCHELHESAAAWFESRDPVTYAEHAGRAALPDAPRAFLEAARSEVSAYRYDRALELIEQGLRLAAESAIRLELRLLQGEVQYQLGDVAGSIDTFRTVASESPPGACLCEALIGVAAGMRVSDELEEAFHSLDRALRVAEDEGLTDKLPRIQYLRGSLFFPLGRVSDCLEAHQAAVEGARETNDPAIEVQALGGLADGYYAVGRMKKAHDTYVQCVARADEHGFGPIAAANRSQIGSLKKFLLEIGEGLELTRQAVEEAGKVGNLRACLNAHISCAELHLERSEVDASQTHLDAAEDLTNRLGAKRFRARILYYRARGHMERDDKSSALALLEDAYAIAHDTGFGYVGPTICASIALVTEDRDRRRRAMEEGAHALGVGALFHNFFEYRRDAIDLALREQRWSDAIEEASLLEERTVDDLPLVSVLIERARLLASVLAGDADQGDIHRLSALAETLRNHGATPYLHLTDRALSAAARE